jgi:tetratricopeptide (TPR) repeat protein
MGSGEYFQYLILSWLTGNPILAMAILFFGYWFADRFTLGILPDPVRWVRRFFKVGKLRRVIAANPHDRRSRFELADLLVGQRRYREALELLRPNIEAGDEDPSTLFLMGLACYGSGHAGQGEVFFTHAEEADPKFRLGAIDLERGRWRLAKGDAKGAIEALERFVGLRKGTIEGRVLLSRATAAAGNDGKAALIREDAWKEYVTAPRFQRRVERLWAWRAKPSRPFTYAVLIAMVAVLFFRFAAPAISEVGGAYSGRGYSSNPYYQGSAGSSSVPQGGAGSSSQTADDSNP